MSLKHIEINIGKACNNKCRFCMSSKPSLWDIKFVSFDILKEKIESYAKKGYDSIGFLGGDVSIHPNLVEIVAFCKKSGFKNINIISNAMIFDDYELCKKLVYNGLTRMNISIHSHKSEIEDYLIQVKGGLKRKLKAIDNFKDLYNKGLLRDDLSINIVLNKKNYEAVVESCLYFFLKKKIKDIRINFIWLNKDVKENWDDLKISYTKFLPYLKQLIYISIKYNIRITFDTIPACIFYKIDSKNYKKLIKKFLGEEYDHITEIDYINKNENFDWKKRKKDMLKTQFKNCKFCEYREVCQGVWKEYGMIYGGTEFIPISNKKQKLYKKNSPLNGVDDFLYKKKIKIFNKNFSIEGIKKLNNDIDIGYFYSKIDSGRIFEVEQDIKKIYEITKNEHFANLYGVLLAKKKQYNQSNKVLLDLINTKNNIGNLGDILYNIAVNYYNLDEIENSKIFIEEAKKYIGNKKYFKEFYKKFKINKK